MKITLKNGNFITDNSKDCTFGCYFALSNSNAKFENVAKSLGAKIITPKEAKTLLGLDDSIKLVGITGTNGKTTTASAIYETLLNLGFKAGISGTRGAFINGKQIADKGLTTSQILETLNYLKLSKEAGCEYFVMEVSSHAIAQDRIEGLKFALKIFTNLSQDHLDFHKTIEEYARVKSSFFKDITPKLINGDDKNLSYDKTNSMTYGFTSDATFYAFDYSLKGGINATIKTNGEEIKFQSSLQGKFNLYNLLCAFGALKFLTKKSSDEISKALSKFSGAPGRVEIVSRNPLVIVDFAHTPDGIEKLLDALKDEELIVVFGAGGDRDKTKRPVMGQIVQRYAKIAIVTSDNPRSEEPSSIIEDIVSKMVLDENVIKEVDRKKAINLALNLAKNGETVVILGKGDEPYQEIKSVKYPFSDKDVVRDILNLNNKGNI